MVDKTTLNRLCVGPLRIVPHAWEVTQHSPTSHDEWELLVTSLNRPSPLSHHLL